MSATADVIVVGAGVIGSSAALELAKLGFRVVVVDKSGGAGHGSTSASSAIVRFNYSTRDGVAASWESQHCWTKWIDHLGFRDPAGTAQFQRTGMIMLDTPLAPPERVTPLFDEVGIPYEHWDPAALKAHIPGIDAGRFWPPKPIDDDDFFADPTDELGGLFTPDAGFIDDPQLAAHNLAAAAEHRGAVFLFNREVAAVDRRDDRVRGVTLTDGRRIDAPVLLNAAGPWSGEFDKLAGVGAEFTVSVRPMRQEVHQVKAPDGFNPDGGFGPTIADMDLGIYARPAPHGLLYIGGTEPECDPLEWIDDPDTANPHPTGERFEAQVTRFARRMPALRIPNKPTGIAGVYDVTDDWTPIYDRTDLAGFYVAIGTSGNQFKNAPVAGRFVAALIEAVENGHDHDSVPVQFHCEHTAESVNLGAFSRKRILNRQSSGTVMG